MYKKEVLEKWTYRDAIELYGIKYWGMNYFNVSEKGEVIVSLPGPKGNKDVSLMEIVKGIHARGLTMPLLLRFRDILESRLSILHQSFNEAIKEYNYKNIFQGVYPIKVNQQEEVIEEITRSGAQFHHGLEAGSKAELIAALAYMHDPQAFIICNGYKDEEFISLALYALKMGIQTILVIERPGELDIILQRSAAIGVKPRIGFRVKLSARGKGLWTESGGDRSVFGLTATQIIDLVDKLKENNMLDCLELLHYHLGSQIPNISSIRAAVSEACRFYVELTKEGARMGILDIGGGLAVDYDGSQTNFESSRNYSINEYCSDVMEAIISVLDDSGTPHPILVTESGRATVAYYSVLLFNILDVNRIEPKGLPAELPKDAHEFLQSLMEVDKTLTAKNIQESYHDAMYYRDEIRSLFLHGETSLRERGLAERIFWHIINRLAKQVKKMKYIPEELQELDKVLVDTYYANFSLFQSLPDSWAIDQLFPIIPIHRLNEEPKNPAVIADTTCDCDGKINHFIDLHDVKSFLPLHDLLEDEDYILGVFLVGAYQETLGDLHNLFGDTNVVSVCLDDDGELEYTRELAGDSVADVLSYVEYDPKKLLNNFRNVAERAVRLKLITANERKTIMESYEDGLRGYTYFES